MVRMRTHDQGFCSFPRPFVRNLPELDWSRKGIPYFRFPRLSPYPQIAHGVFTRRGGASLPPYHSLNASYAVGDDPRNVTENLRKIRKELGSSHLIFLNQVHGDRVFALGKNPGEALDKIPTADAMITNVPKVALMVKLADCQGIIILDPEKKVVANVHCGWRGSVRNILAQVVKAMKERFSCRPCDLIAVIGPSLGPCCAEFVDHRTLFPETFREFMVREDYFDLWAISCRQLLEAGLREESIEVAGVCTRCHPDLFYSYRGEGETGRFAMVAMLRSW